MEKKHIFWYLTYNCLLAFMSEQVLEENNFLFIRFNIYLTMIQPALPDIPPMSKNTKTEFKFLV